MLCNKKCCSLHHRGVYDRCSHVFPLPFWSHSVFEMDHIQTVSINIIQNHFQVIFINDVFFSMTHCWPWCFFCTGFTLEPPKLQHVSSHYRHWKSLLGDLNQLWLHFAINPLTWSWQSTTLNHIHMLYSQYFLLKCLTTSENLELIKQH